MIYFDNSATTLIKPPEVSGAVSYALDHFGNPGRSFYDPALMATREIFNTRREIAKLIGLDDPLQVAFTSSATESLNLVIAGLIRKEDSVLTTVAEHNSVLRPLYLTGCELDFIDCDDKGNLQVDSFDKLVKPTTRFLICTHGSNVIGTITDAHALYEKCKAKGITMILDIAQTFGAISVDRHMADIFCFTGHKSLFGPQGTGGVITNGNFDFNIVKTGGAGVNSFESLQAKEMPDIFEVGTLNSHGLHGLQKGVRFINEIGVAAIHEKHNQLLRRFLDGVNHCKMIHFYGDVSSQHRLPVVALSIKKMTSAELAGRLWQEYGIATRPGSHCAPLLHKRFGTIDTGMVRFSFSYFNTDDEIDCGISALRNISS